MKKRRFLIISVFLLALILTGCSLSSGSANSWAYSFVKWEDNPYKITQESIDNVGKKIGTVTSRTDIEGTYEGNFLNSFPVGTDLYEIKGISTSEAIAVESPKGKFIKAINDNFKK